MGRGRAGGLGFSVGRVHDAFHDRTLAKREVWRRTNPEAGNGGDTQWFHSDLHLLLDSNVGFFVSYNSAGKDEISPRTVLFDKFMERYFPVASGNEPTVSSAAQDAHKVAGLYKISRRFETNLLAVTTVLGEAKIAADAKDNTIYIEDFLKNLNGKAKHFREIAPMVFRAVDGPEKITFQNDASGHTTVFIDYPFMVFQPVGGALDNKILNYVILGCSLGVIALTLLLWPVAAILRKHYAKPLTLSPQARRLRMLMHIVCIAVVVYLIGVALVLQALEKLALGASGDWKIHLLQVLGVLIGLGALIAIYNSLKSWGDPEQWGWYKIWNTLLAFGCVGFFWFIYHWHLLNFDLRY